MNEGIKDKDEFGRIRYTLQPDIYNICITRTDGFYTISKLGNAERAFNRLSDAKLHGEIYLSRYGNNTKKVESND